MESNIAEHLTQGDLEKDIIGAFIANKECIAKTILQPKHFLNDTNKRMFILLKNYYQKHKEIDMPELFKQYDGNIKVQQVILSYIDYTSEYVVGIMSEFQRDEKKLIKVWQKEESKKYFEEYINGRIDYKTLKIQLDEINYNQFFKNILDISKDIEDTTPINTKEREYTEIQQLDYLTKGIEYGTLNVWSSVTNGGKTTLMTQFAKNFIKKDKKVFYFNGEQTAKEFKNNLFVSMCSKGQIQYVKDTNNENIIDIMPKDDVLEQLNIVVRDKLYVYNNEIPKNDIETMISVMEEAYDKGVRIFFIDNFMQLDSSEMLDQQTRIIEKFKRFARDKNSIVMLVAHPRKLNFGTTRLNIFDISGTQNISNKSANICTIIRKDTMTDLEKDIIFKYLLENDYNLEECDSVIEVLKTKGNKNGVVGLTYDRELKIFQEARKITLAEKEHILAEIEEEKFERKDRKKGRKNEQQDS